MIDTVVLKIPKHLIQMDNSPNWQSFLQNEYSQKWIRNMTVEEKRNQIYRPRVTGQKRTGCVDSIKIEFSCPKIIFANNVDELVETDFPTVIDRLQATLKEIGLFVPVDVLKKAQVLSFHPSKNIELSKGYTSRFVIKELNKINIKKIFDLNKTDFRNDGQSLQVYSNSHSLVFYDKIADLNKALKRAIDRDQTIQQLSLFEQIKRTCSTLEILRMEVRLCNKRKINSLLKKLKFSINPIFQDLFNNRLCQKIILDYWENTIKHHNGLVLNTFSSPYQVLSNLIRASPEISAKEAVYLVGLKCIANQEAGISALRSLIEKGYSPRTWYRVAKDMKRLNQMSKLPKQDWVNQIENQLSGFRPLRKS